MTSSNKGPVEYENVSACWCNTPLDNSSPTPYSSCSRCGTYVLKRRVKEAMIHALYDLDYWFEGQTSIGDPDIKERARKDFEDRIPYWYNILKCFHPEIGRASCRERV